MSARAAIYLDANAGIPPLPVIRDSMAEILPLLHNPSSSHGHGRAARALITRAKSQITRLLEQWLPGLTESGWVFTSGVTESIQGVLRAAGQSGLLRFAQPVEHSASLSFAESQPVFMPMDSTGRVDVDALESFLDTFLKSTQSESQRPFLATLLWVNNETGAIQHRMNDVCRIIKNAGGWVLVDGAQALGKLSDHLEPQNWDFFAASAHKLGGFSGTGLLAFSESGRKLLQSHPVFFGGQQAGIRAGTENALGAWAFGVAAQADVWAPLRGVKPQLGDLRNELAARMMESVPGTKIHVPLGQCIPNTLSVGFDGISAKAGSLVTRLDLEGFSVSAGSACSSGIRKPSHVLKALGCSDALALASLRISLPPSVRFSEIEEFILALSRCVSSLRGAS
jgi:cysteine desulfurase